MIIDYSLLNSVFLVIFGFCVGMVGTFIGVGGGVAVVPILTLAYNFPPQYAIGTSLAVIFINTLSGTTVYVRQKRINYKVGIYFALATIPGAIIGSYIAQLFDKWFFQLFFGAILSVIAIYTFIGIRYEKTAGISIACPVRNSNSNGISNKKLLLGVYISFFVGIISSILGIGGGIIHIPVMLFIIGISTHTATATSHFILAITSFTGSMAFLYYGQMVLGYMLLIGGGALIGAQLGGWMSNKAKGIFIRRIFAAALIILAVKLIYEGICYLVK